MYDKVSECARVVLLLHTPTEVLPSPVSSITYGSHAPVFSFLFALKHHIYDSVHSVIFLRLHGLYSNKIQLELHEVRKMCISNEDARRRFEV